MWVAIESLGNFLEISPVSNQQQAPSVFSFFATTQLLNRNRRSSTAVNTRSEHDQAIKNDSFRDWGAVIQHCVIILHVGIILEMIQNAAILSANYQTIYVEKMQEWWYIWFLAVKQSSKFQFMRWLVPARLSWKVCMSSSSMLKARNSARVYSQKMPPTKEIVCWYRIQQVSNVSPVFQKFFR